MKRSRKGHSFIYVSSILPWKSSHPSQCINSSASPWTSWVLFDCFTFHHRVVTWIAQADQESTREASSCYFNLPTEQEGMQSLNELQDHTFKITWVTWVLRSTSATVLIFWQWDCIQLCTYLFLCLYNPLTSNCTTKALRTETPFWHSATENWGFWRCTLSALQYLDLQQHNLLQKRVLLQNVVWN